MDFEKSLHKADHLHESPDDNTADQLLTRKELLDGEAVEKVSSLNDKKVDQKILFLASQIRNEQDWVLPNDLLIDDFAGDYKAFTMAKMEGGIKMLS